jgi:hypothetical protein
MMRYGKTLVGYALFGVLLGGGLLLGGIMMLANAPVSGEPVRRVEAICGVDTSKLEDQEEWLPNEMENRGEGNGVLWCSSPFTTIISIVGNGSAFLPMPSVGDEVTMYSKGYACDYCNGFKGWACVNLGFDDMGINEVECTIFDKVDLDAAEQYENKDQWVVFGHGLDDTYDRSVVQGGAIAMVVIGAIIFSFLTTAFAIATMASCKNFKPDAEPEMALLNLFFCMNPLARLFWLLVSPVFVAVGILMGTACFCCLVCYPCYIVLHCVGSLRGSTYNRPATPVELIGGITLSLPMCLSPLKMLEALVTCAHPCSCCGCGEGEGTGWTHKVTWQKKEDAYVANPLEDRGPNPVVDDHSAATGSDKLGDYPLPPPAVQP